MESKKKHIIGLVEKLMKQQGIKSLTMDEVARQAGISKKTLYKYFKNKEDLLAQVIHHQITVQNEKFVMPLKETTDPIEKLIRTKSHLKFFFSSMPEIVFNELRKYYPGLLKLYLHYKKDHIYKNIEKNLLEGIEKGYYRKEIDVKLIAGLFLSAVEHLFDADFLLAFQTNTEQAFEELLIYHILGIATKKGRQKYNLISQTI